MHPQQREDVPLIYVDMAATLLMEIWATDKSARVQRTQLFMHTFTSPIFNIGEFVWLPIVMQRVNKYLLAAHREDWSLLDRDFSRAPDVTDLVDSDLD